MKEYMLPLDFVLSRRVTFILLQEFITQIVLNLETNCKFHKDLRYIGFTFWQCFIRYIDWIFFYININMRFTNKSNFFHFFKYNKNERSKYPLLYHLLYRNTHQKRIWKPFSSILFYFRVIIPFIKGPFRGCLAGGGR